MNKAEEIIRSVRQVPVLPATAVRLLETMRNSRHDALDVTRVVASDPGLTVNLLKVVNSPVFGLRSEVLTLERAVQYLGDRVVIGVALSLELGEMYGTALTGYSGEPGGLLRHSLTTALACRELAARSRTELAGEEAFTAGLLHDLGKALLSEYLRGETQGILHDLDIGRARGFDAAEEQRLGTDHAAVGAALLAHWRLPRRLVDVIRHHHAPGGADMENRGMAYIVHLGDIVSMMGGYGTGADSLQYALDERYEEWIDVSVQGLEEIVLKVTQEFERFGTPNTGRTSS